MQRIKLLDPNTTSKIAAGEVIERPASAVKELLENSLDAKATSIKLSIVDAGLQSIIIQDNGYGIHADDLELAIIAHATSKLTSIEDLTETTSLGFRGEALASINSISKLQLTSRTQTQALAQQLKMQGGKLISNEECVADVGTTIAVDDLFFNVPVRKKFLKSTKTELMHIDNVVKRIMLSNFNIRYKVIYDNKIIYNLSPANNLVQQENRLTKLLSKSFLANAVAISIENDGMCLHGWLALPALGRRQSDWQFFYLNGRIVKDRLLQHAIRQAYADSLEENFQPAYVLYLTITPKLADINVHPTKQEARFQDSRLVHDFIVSALRKALSEPVLVSEDIVSTSQLELPDAYEQVTINTKVPQYLPTNKVDTITCKSNSHDWQILLLLGKRLAIAQQEQQLYLFNLLEMQLHGIYEALTTTKQIKPLLVPVMINTKAAQYLQNSSATFARLGLEFDYLGDDNLVIRRAHQAYQAIDLQQLFKAMQIQQDYPLDLQHELCLLILHAMSEQYPKSIDTKISITEFYQAGFKQVSFRGINIWSATSVDNLLSLI